MRLMRLPALTAAALLTLPAPAFAAEVTLDVPAWLGFGMGGFALFVSAILLVEVARLRRLAEGSAFADNMAYVMAGIITLAASALAGWLAFLGLEGMSRDLVRVVSDALVGVSMVLLGIYFWRVRRAMKSYLSVLTYGDDEALAAIQAHEADEEPPGA